MITLAQRGKEIVTEAENGAMLSLKYNTDIQLEPLELDWKCGLISLSSEPKYQG